MVCPKCGGRIIDGYLYGDRVVAGKEDLKMIYNHLSEPYAMFPQGLPERGPAVHFCEKCFQQYKDLMK